MKHTRSSHPLLLGLLAVFSAAGAAADDSSVDDLFGSAKPQDQVADLSQGLTVDQLNGQSLRVFESMSADGYYIGGYSEAEDRWANTPYNALDFRFGTDLRLDTNIRAYASFGISYPDKSTSTSDNLYNPYGGDLPDPNPTARFSSLKIQEIFLDYSLANTLYVRIGREQASWGQGQILNPSNFIAGQSTGLGASVSFALGGATWTGEVIKNDDYYGTSTSLDNAAGLDTLGVAAKVESTWWGTSAGLSAFYQAYIGQKAAVYLKREIWGADVMAEAMVERASYDRFVSTPVEVQGDPIPTLLFGAFREFGGSHKWLRIQAECMVTGRSGSESAVKIPVNYTSMDDISFGVGATSEALKSLKLTPKLAWLHSVQDQSGQLVFGLTSTALPHIDLVAGTLWIYGPDAGRYAANNPDSTLDRRLLFTLKVSFKADFDKQ